MKRSSDHTAATTVLWRASAAKQALAVIGYPLFYGLNRPAFRTFNEAIYDFALRCNGIAINVTGVHGLTIGEEKFLRRYVPNGGGEALFDVGANHGAYARFLHSLAPQSRIYSFKPHPRTFDSLRAETTLPNVTLVNQAMGSQEGQAMLFGMAATGGSTQVSLNRNAVELFTDDVTTHEVLCTTFDRFAERNGIERVCLLKVDTKGHDLAALQGASEAIAARRTSAIQFEFIPANIATGVSMRDFFDVLPGYRLFRLCMNGDLLPLARYDVKRCEIYVTHNPVALPA